jgi:hypothetical protein
MTEDKAEFWQDLQHKTQKELGRVNDQLALIKDELCNVEGRDALTRARNAAQRIRDLARENDAEQLRSREATATAAALRLFIDSEMDTVHYYGPRGHESSCPGCIYERVGEIGRRIAALAPLWEEFTRMGLGMCHPAACSCRRCEILALIAKFEAKDKNNANG